MKVLLGGGLALIFLGITYYYSPLGTVFLKQKLMAKATGIILITLGTYIVFRALTL